MGNCENCGKEFDNCGIFTYCDDCVDLVPGEPETPDGICPFCGEELQMSVSYGDFCGNCGFNESYEQSKVRGDDY